MCLTYLVWDQIQNQFPFYSEEQGLHLIQLHSITYIIHRIAFIVSSNGKVLHINYLSSKITVRSQKYTPFEQMPPPSLTPPT